MYHHSVPMYLRTLLQAPQATGELSTRKRLSNGTVGIHRLSMEACCATRPPHLQHFER